jgi:hypothetical protein
VASASRRRPRPSTRVNPCGPGRYRAHRETAK